MCNMGYLKSFQIFVSRQNNGPILWMPRLVAQERAFSKCPHQLNSIHYLCDQNMFAICVDSVRVDSGGTVIELVERLIAEIELK